MKKGLEEKLASIKSYPSELGLNLSERRDRFKWFLASILFAKRISSKIAKNTFQKFMENCLDNPNKILHAGWDRLVEILDSGGYVRYDFSTASNLLEIMRKLIQEYNGDIDEIHSQAMDSKDLEKRLMEFKGIGPVAVSIFLRELRDIWSKAKPRLSSIALNIGKKLGLNIDEITSFESKLVKIAIEYCKKKRCDICPVNTYCRDGLSNK